MNAVTRWLLTRRAAAALTTAVLTAEGRTVDGTVRPDSAEWRIYETTTAAAWVAYQRAEATAWDAYEAAMDARERVA